MTQQSKLNQYCWSKISVAHIMFLLIPATIKLANLNLQLVLLHRTSTTLLDGHLISQLFTLHRYCTGISQASGSTGPGQYWVTNWLFCNRDATVGRIVAMFLFLRFAEKVEHSPDTAGHYPTCYKLHKTTAVLFLLQFLQWNFCKNDKKYFETFETNPEEVRSKEF